MISTSKLQTQANVSQPSVLMGERSTSNTGFNGTSGSTVRDIPVHSSRKLHTCHICYKAFFIAGHLKDHMVLHKNKSLAGKEFKSPKIPLERKPHMHINHVCKCKLKKTGEFASQDRRLSPGISRQCRCLNQGKIHTCPLIIHEPFHRNEKSCKGCKFTEIDGGGLKQNNMAQPGYNLQKCIKCDTAKQHLYSLKIHLHNHKCRRLYQCSHCAAKFSHKCLLYQHRKSFH